MELVLIFGKNTYNTPLTIWQTTWQNMATWQKSSLTAHIWQLGKELGKSSL